MCRITCSPFRSRRRHRSARSSASRRWTSSWPSGPPLTRSFAGSSTSRPRARGESGSSGWRSRTSACPSNMKRSMSRQAEAERERRARIITADGEYQASKRLAAAANVMARDPAALQLRLLQTVVEVAAEKNSTLVMPVPVELLRFFDKFTPAEHGRRQEVGRGFGLAGRLRRCRGGRSRGGDRGQARCAAGDTRPPGDPRDTRGCDGAARAHRRRMPALQRGRGASWTQQRQKRDSRRRAR